MREDFNFLVPEGRDVGDLEERRKLPSCSIRFTSCHTKGKRDLDEILLLLLNIDGTDGHSICFKMRVANTHAWREGEGPRLEGMLTADADRPHVRINALVECCLRSGDVVFSPQIRGFRDNLGSSEVLRAVEREAVAVNFVANRGDGTSQRTFAVLKGSANGVVLTEGNVAAEGRIAHVSLEFSP